MFDFIKMTRQIYKLILGMNFKMKLPLVKLISNNSTRFFFNFKFILKKYVCNSFGTKKTIVVDYIFTLSGLT